MPDYKGGGIVNLMASLQEGLGGAKHAYPVLRHITPDDVGRHRQVVLWVIDGLGYEHLLRQTDAVHLNAALKARITSVFPPTTASAITTFLTGDAPQQHGLTGWYVYFRELGAILTVLPGRSRYGGGGYGSGGIDTAGLLQHRPFSDRIGVESYSLSPAYIVDSEFNRVHLGSSTAIGFTTLEGLCQETLALCHRPGRRYISIYWPELDSLGHRHGIGSAQVNHHLLELDRAFHHLCRGLEGTGTLLLVCADHGQVDTTPEQTFFVDRHPDLCRSLVLPLCGEPRAAYGYIRSGYASQFDESVASCFGDRVVVHPSSQLIDECWFGLGAPHDRLQDRIGDRLLLMQEQAIVIDRLPQDSPLQMIGVHGGLSREELWVPLIAVSS